MSGEIPSVELIAYTEVGSTMEEAKVQLDKGMTLPFWLLAEEQKEGRGRRGRTWQSPRGNFYGTLVFRPDERLPVHAYNFAAGIALYEAVRDVTGVLPDRLRLKWPNDLLLDGRKLAGMLCETYRGHALLGMGINLVPQEGVEPYGRAPAALSELDGAIRPIALLSRLHPLVFEWFNRLSDYGLADIITEWKKRGPQPGSHWQVETAHETIKGYYDGVDEFGRLLLKTDNGLITVTTGDVSF